MKPPPPASEKDLGRDLKTFEQLPPKTKELDLIKDLAEKTTGPEGVTLAKKVLALSEPKPKKSRRRAGGSS